MPELTPEQQRDFARALVGRATNVLIEKPGRNEGQWVGHSPLLMPVILDEKPGEIGDIVDVRITRTGANSLFAESI